MQPVPGYKVTTPFGRRGSHWSCKPVGGKGIHTGIDIAAPTGTWIVAPISGQIRHRNYGGAFGRHQFAISPDPGQPFDKGEVFFAHTITRPFEGVYVKAGERIAKVGAEGNVTGPHLHMEYMPNTKGKWNCSVHADPQPIIDWEPEMGLFYRYSGKPKGILTIDDADGYVRLDIDTEPDPPTGGDLEFKYLYANCELVWDEGATAGVIRVKFRREDGDETAFQDFTVIKGVSIGEPDTFLVNAMHMELSEKNKGGRWYMRADGGLKAIKIGTRYCKVAVVS